MDVSDYDSLDASERSLRDFERMYLATRVVKALRESPWVSEAYLAPTWTPATDYSVYSRINESEGDSLWITWVLHGCGGRQILVANNYSFNLWSASSGDFSGGHDPWTPFWKLPGNRLGAYERESEQPKTDDLNRAGRLFGYLGYPQKPDGLPAAWAAAWDEFKQVRGLEYLRFKKRTGWKGLTEEELEYLEANKTRGYEAPSIPQSATELMDQAARIEREKVLAGLTDLAIAHADKASEAYLDWQLECCRAEEKAARIREKAQKLREQQQMKAMLAQLQNAGAPPASLQDSINQLGVALQDSLEVRSQIDDIHASADAVLEAKQEFNAVFSHEIAPIEVELSGEVFELSGRQDAMLSRLRDVVKERLLEMLAEASP